MTGDDVLERIFTTATVDVELSQIDLHALLDYCFPGQPTLSETLEIVVLEQLAQDVPLDPYALRLGQWRVDVPTRLLQAASASAILSGAIEVAGVNSVPLTIVAAIIPFLVDIERVELRTRDQVVLAALSEPLPEADRIGAVYNRLPDALRNEVSLLEFADIVDRLRAAGKKPTIHTELEHAVTVIEIELPVERLRR